VSPPERGLLHLRKGPFGALLCWLLLLILLASAITSDRSKGPLLDLLI
jgi:hypothetical protein